MRQSKDPKYIRLKVVQYALMHGNKPAARKFRTMVKTLRKWRLRYENNSYKGLEDASKAPKKPLNAISQKQKYEMKKLPSYQLYFNIARKNSYKNNKTPWEIIQERNDSVTQNIFLLPPLFRLRRICLWQILNSINKNRVIKNKHPGEYHVRWNP